MGYATSRLTAAAAFVRTHGAKIALEAAVNFVLPFLVYSYARASLGDVRALMAATAPPVLWSIVGFIRERKLDAISILVLAGIGLSLLAFAGGGGVKFLQLRENLVAGLVGLIFLASAAFGRPLILQLARAGVGRRSADAIDAFAALSDDARFRREMTVATVVWGAGLLAVCAVNCALVFAVPIKVFLLISGPIGYGALGLLTAWTFWSVPRAKREAEARQGQTS